MSSSAPSTPDDLSQPIFTREALLAIEAQLTHDQPNNSDDEPDHSVVLFHGEREWNQAKRDGKQGEFSCVVPGAIQFHAPHRDAAQANDRWQYLDNYWEMNPSRLHLLRFVQSRPNAVATVDKVFGFGLGPICAAQPSGLRPTYVPDMHLLEHMAVLSIANEISTIRSQPVTVYTADPLYTAECKRALRAMGIQVIDGFGAVGFTMVDDHSIVVTQYPSFPVRQLLADLCRPVAFIGNREKTREEVAALSEEEQKGPLDPDTERTRKMLDGYEREKIEESPLKNQWWYWRK